MALADLAGNQPSHGDVEALRVQHYRRQLQLRAEGPDQRFLADHAHLDQVPADVPAPALLLVQGSLQGCLIEVTRLDEDFAELLAWHRS